MIEPLHFYFSNDLHSHFENWSSIVNYFKDKKRKHLLDEEESWRMDIGDHVDRYHPISEAFKGKANVKLLNQAEYDFATIGNNEGITLEYKDLFHLYDEANFQVTCANLKSINKETPKWLKEDITVKTKSGLTIKIVGLTAPFTPFYEPLGWEVETPFDYLRRESKILKQGADILILLSHLGLSDDEAIARDFPEFDVIIGGHTHHLLKNGQQINDTLLAAAGKFGKYIGEVHVDWNHEENKIEKKQAYTVETAYIEEDEDTRKTIQGWTEKAQEKLNQPVATLDEKLTVDWFQPTPLIEQLTQFLKEWTNADMAMLNAGILLDGVEKGNVTYGDIHRICPHPINPCTVKLRGIEVMEVVRGAYDTQLKNLQLKGFGFRGEVIGEPIFSGLEVITLLDTSNQEQVKEVYFEGEPIDKDRLYTFATADMFTFGNMFPEISRSSTKKFYLPEFLRDLLVRTLQSIGTPVL